MDKGNSWMMGSMEESASVMFTFSASSFATTSLSYVCDVTAVVGWYSDRRHRDLDKREISGQGSSFWNNTKVVHLINILMAEKRKNMRDYIKAHPDVPIQTNLPKGNGKIWPKRRGESSHA